jgi:hypothetical protein
MRRYSEQDERRMLACLNVVSKGRHGNRVGLEEMRGLGQEAKFLKRKGMIVSTAVSGWRMTPQGDNLHRDLKALYPEPPPVVTYDQFPPLEIEALYGV